MLTEYEAKVVAFLDKLKVGQTIRIEKFTKPETREQFIEVVKLYIDAWGNCEFSNDYQFVKRIQPFVIKKDEGLRYDLGTRLGK